MFLVYYQTNWQQVAADRMSCDHHPVATFDNKDDADSYIKKSNPRDELKVERITDTKFNSLPRNTPHNPK